jgi:acyl phosphate:glycerol-3-phosphate acyltransferase
MFFRVDVRQKGSGNAGATNTIRVLGPKAGIPVLLIDILKGFLAVRLAYLFAPEYFSIEQMANFKIGLALAATIGHIFPVYVGFKGGKGVATLVGILVALYPDTILFVVSVFVLVFVLFHYISLASVISAVSFPLFVLFLSKEHILSLIVFSILVGVFVPLTHKKNLRRLWLGEESKFSIRRTKK